jgi:hypothetical protein
MMVSFAVLLVSLVAALAVQIKSGEVSAVTIVILSVIFLTVQVTLSTPDSSPSPDKGDKFALSWNERQ